MIIIFILLRPLQLIYALCASRLFVLLLRSACGYTITPKTWGEACADYLTRSGPLFIKLGQLLSTRNDIFSQAFLTPLEALQDTTQALHDAVAHKSIEKAFQRPLSSLFLSFDHTPIASASIAQVHTAVLHDGRHVVVKLQRPGVKNLIYCDIFYLTGIAWLVSCIPAFKGLHARAIVREFEHMLLKEINFTLEASAMSQCARQYVDNKNIYIPQVIWPYVTPEAFIMEYVTGIHLRDLDIHKISAQERHTLATQLLSFFLHQVFITASFHGDLHPGNILIDIHSSPQPRIILIDFGIMGDLSLHDRYFLYANFSAILRHDYTRIAQLHHDAGWVPKHTDITTFSIYARSVLEPLYHVPLHDISIAQCLSRLLSIGNHFHMRLLPELCMLQKSLVHLESILRHLDPSIRVFNVLQKLRSWHLTLYKEIAQHYLATIPSALLPDKAPQIIQRDRDILWFFCITNIYLFGTSILLYIIM